MKKTREFKRVIFDTTILKQGVEILNSISNYENNYSLKFLSIELEGESWLHDNLEEYFSDYRKDFKTANLVLEKKNFKLEVSVNKYLLKSYCSVLNENDSISQCELMSSRIL